MCCEVKQVFHFKDMASMNGFLVLVVDDDISVWIILSAEEYKIKTEILFQVRLKLLDIGIDVPIFEHYGPELPFVFL